MSWIMQKQIDTLYLNETHYEEALRLQEQLFEQSLERLDKGEETLEFDVDNNISPFR